MAQAGGPSPEMAAGVAVVGASGDGTIRAPLPAATRRPAGPSRRLRAGEGHHGGTLTPGRGGRSGGPDPLDWDRQAAYAFLDSRERDVGFEDFLGDDDPEGGVEFGGAAGEEGGLARSRGAGEDDGEAGSDGGLDEAGDGLVEHVALDELVEAADLDSRELADVDQDVAVAADVVVDDVEAAAVVELGVLEAFGGVEFAVAG